MKCVAAKGSGISDITLMRYKFENNSTGDRLHGKKLVSNLINTTKL